MREVFLDVKEGLEIEIQGGMEDDLWIKSPCKKCLHSHLVHCEKNITLLRIKNNRLCGFGTQNAIELQPLAMIWAKTKGLLI